MGLTQSSVGSHDSKSRLWWELLLFPWPSTHLHGLVPLLLELLQVPAVPLDGPVAAGRLLPHGALQGRQLPLPLPQPLVLLLLLCHQLPLRLLGLAQLLGTGRGSRGPLLLAIILLGCRTGLRLPRCPLVTHLLERLQLARVQRVAPRLVRLLPCG